MSETPIDVAIIGGGAAGAYTAYRLKTNESTRPLNVHLFELSDRIGGRLLSVNLPGLPHNVAELGGECFTQLPPTPFLVVINPLIHGDTYCDWPTPDEPSPDP